VPVPDTGNQPSETAKTMARTGPSQKLGMEMPINETVMAAWSMAVPRNNAPMTPSGMARQTATTMAAAANSIVRGSRCPISFATGVP